SRCTLAVTTIVDTVVADLGSGDDTVAAVRAESAVLSAVAVAAGVGAIVALLVISFDDAVAATGTPLAGIGETTVVTRCVSWSEVAFLARLENAIAAARPEDATRLTTGDHTVVGPIITLLFR